MLKTAQIAKRGIITLMEPKKLLYGLPTASNPAENGINPPILLLSDIFRHCADRGETF